MEHFNPSSVTVAKELMAPVGVLEAVGDGPLEDAGLWRAALDASTDCIAMLTAGGSLLWMNPSAWRVLGCIGVDNPIGQAFVSLWPRDHWSAISSTLATAQRGGIGSCTLQLVSPSGKAGWWDVSVQSTRSADRAPARLMAVVREVTERQAALERLRWTAEHDPLTTLGNRALFYETLDGLLRNKDSKAFGVAMIDLDHFKLANDRFGHGAGDAMLREIATRLTARFRDGDQAARLGGDEFALILRAPFDGRDLRMLGKSIITRLCRPFIHEGREIECSASAGLALFPEHGRTADELCRHADAALYAAKAAGRGRLVCFNTSVGKALQRRSHMISLARDALAEKRIMPWYQPKVDLQTGQVVGFEALLRWRTAAGRIALPGALLEAFDEHDIGQAITAAMLDHIIADLSRWQALGIQLPVAINVTAGDLARETFAVDLLSRLNVAGIAPELVEIEITETVFLGRHVAHARTLLRALSAAGIRIALDDFGTGYASLAHLKHYPVDILKIDRSFIKNLQTDPNDQAIVEAIIGLAANLSMEIVAEGIETTADADYLRSRGCALGQGFLFGKAAPARLVPKLLTQRRDPQGIRFKSESLKNTSDIFKSTASMFSEQLILAGGGG